MSSPLRPLIVRLRNWVGDVVLGVPTLQRLEAAGYSLRLIGQPWAADLLAGHGWQVHALPKTASDRVAQLRALRRAACEKDPGFDRRLNAVCWPYSFSSALDFRLAGLKATGHAHEGRSWLLSQAVQRSADAHESAVYWHLASALLHEDEPEPRAVELKVSAHHARRALALLESQGMHQAPIVICPFAGGTWKGQDKTWPAFEQFAAETLPRFGRPVLVCPGPGNERSARERFPGAIQLSGLDLGTYAALLKHAAVMVSNDTGPGHIAAAVGAPLVSVLGPSDPSRWGALGPRVRLVRGHSGWPDPCRVRDAVAEALLPSPALPLARMPGTQAAPRHAGAQVLLSAGTK